MEKIFWHLTKDEQKILNLAVVSGGSTIERSKYLAPKFELKSSW